MEHQEIVFRKTYLSAFALSVACLFVGLSIGIAVTNDITGRLLGLPVMFIMTYGMWLLGWHSGVRLKADELIVDNLAMRHHVSWGKFARFTAEGGLGVHLKDRREIASVTFGGSVIGEVLKYRHTKRVRDRMDAARLELMKDADSEDDDSGDGEYWTEVCLPRMPMVVISVTLGVIAVVPSLF